MKCKIDGVEVGEVSVNLFATPTFTAKYALINKKEKTRFGAGTLIGTHNLSDDTVKKLTTFLEALEADIAKNVFEEDEASQPEIAPEAEIPGL